MSYDFAGKRVFLSGPMTGKPTGWSIGHKVTGGVDEVGTTVHTCDGCGRVMPSKDLHSTAVRPVGGFTARAAFELCPECAERVAKAIKREVRECGR